jgi:acetoin utilization deacetylase AcuC-like enzyme/ribosomal protein S18 acetylase RimI-like enzyme
LLTFLTVHEIDTEPGRRQVAEAQAIFRESFPTIAEEAEAIPSLVKKERELGYGARLLVAEKNGHVAGFATILYFPECGFAYLDYIATATQAHGHGLGVALYDAVRETARRFGARGLFLEVRPDDRSVHATDAEHRDAVKRLRFYERLNVLPIAGTTYDKPIRPGGDYTLLLYDGLGRERPLRATELKAALASILVHKYKIQPSDPQHVAYLRSVKQDPVETRHSKVPPRGATDDAEAGPVSPAADNVPARPLPAAAARPSAPLRSIVRPVKLIFSNEHSIHHIAQRGYVETPARVDAIARAFVGSPLIEFVRPRHFDEKHIRAVHAPDFVSYLARMCKTLEPKELVYPYVFPLRRPEKKPREMAIRAGYYCMDTFTPLTNNAYTAARAAVDIALTGAQLVLAGHRIVYALCRPPGHHAERRVFGGFCYFNNAAIAANLLSQHGRVVLLDLDYHHGNGSQDIFYKRSDVSVISIHGHPNHAYPYFSGFEDERGVDEGLGYNLNIPLPEHADDDVYALALKRALAAVDRHRPRFLVVSLGLDIARNDPTGDFRCTVRTFVRIGRELAALGLPVLCVQEGGYNTRQIGPHARRVFTELASRP